MGVTGDTTHEQLTEWLTLSKPELNDSQICPNKEPWDPIIGPLPTSPNRHVEQSQAFWKWLS